MRSPSSIFIKTPESRRISVFPVKIVIYINDTNPGTGSRMGVTGFLRQGFKNAPAARQDESKASCS